MINKDKELRDQKKLLELQSKEILDIEHSMPVPNTAKSYLDKRKSSNKTKQEISQYKEYVCESSKNTTKRRNQRTVSQIAESAEIIKTKLMKVQNAFNTTAASSHHFKSTDTSNSKHKRSKTQNNVNVLDSEVSVLSKGTKNEDVLAQIKSEMKTLYETSGDGKYKFLPNSKIVYVTKSQVKRKGSKRCNSTDGTTSQNYTVKRKVNRIAKNSKQSMLKAKNRKYFNPATKDVLCNLNNSFSRENKSNPQQEYMDQMKRKQRYTAFDCSLQGESIMKDRTAGSLSGKLSSFSGTYYHGSSKLV